MRWLALAIGVGGTIAGAITVHLELGDFFHGVRAGSPHWTIAVLVIGFLASLLVPWKTKMAAWVLLAVALLGVFGNYIMWEGPGTFFLASALIGFTNGRTKQDAVQPESQGM